MKPSIYITVALCLLAFSPLKAQETVTGVTVSDVKLERTASGMEATMTFDLSKLKVTRNRAVLLTPCLYNGNDTVHLKSIGVYGRRHYYQYIRNDRDELFSGPDEITYRKKDMPQTLSYQDEVAYEPWMDGAKLQLHRTRFGCCEKVLNQETALLGQYKKFVPDLVYVKPKVEAKTRALEGTAFIDFPLDKTVIEPTYRNNKSELAKIDETINSVKSDSDFTINSISLKGYASPEGPYKHNEELSIGRVNALKDYVQKLHSFSSSDITIANEPENWEGLKKYVEASDLEHKAEILKMIDSDMEPDAKEAKIKATYPTEYKYLLDNCYPALRRTDYKVNYTVREFSDIEEIKNMYNTNPSKLSPAELYQLAETYGTGSDDYYDILKKTYDLNPSDEVSSINAANLAMKNEDLELAEKCLSSAGDRGEAAYARGVLSAMEENYAEAAGYFQKAKDQGFEKADENLEFVNGLLR